MAIASKKTQVIQIHTFSLTNLTEREASVIMALVGKVAGTGDNRDAAGSVYNALRDAGLTTTSDPWMGESETLATKISKQTNVVTIHMDNEV